MAPVSTPPRATAPVCLGSRRRPTRLRLRLLPGSVGAGPRASSAPRDPRHLLLAALLAMFVLARLAWALPAAHAQSAPAQPAPAAAQQAPDQTDTGGPSVDNGPIVIPQKKEHTAPPPPPALAEPKSKNPNGETYSITVNVPEVHLDVSVILDKNHQFVPGLKPPNFLV